MANRVWSGATDGDINNTANWVGGVIPDASGTDVAIFNQGSVDADTNVTAPTNAQWGGVIVMPGYTGNIGGSGNKLTVGATTVKHFGSGALWLEDGGTTTDVFIACQNQNAVVDLGGNTMANVTLLRGNVTIAGDMGVITRLTIGTLGGVGDVSATLTSGMSAVTSAVISSGNVTLNATITTLDIAGGTLTLPVASSGTVTNCYQTGGTVNHNTTSTVTELYTTGGLFNLGSAAKTVTKVVHVGNLISDGTLHTLTTEFDLSNVNELA